MLLKFIEMSTDPTEAATRTTLHQKGIGVLIWLAFAAVGIGVLYWFSLLMGD